MLKPCCDLVQSGSDGGDSRDAPAKNGDNHCGGVVERPRFFAGISPADYAGICRAARSTEFTRGEMLYFEGDAVTHLFLLTSGAVKITKLGSGGEEVILRLTVPGDALGAMGLFSTGMHCTTAQVYRACRALVWNARDFTDLAERFPVLRQNMVAILDEHLRELEDRFREVATDRVAPRVALQLLRLVKKIGRPVNAGVEIGLSHEDVAQMTGTTLFTISRLFSAWEVRGVVRTRRNAVAICDISSLQAISEEA